MANNQITPFQLTDQFTMDNFNQRINETNIALQKKVNHNLLDNWYFGNPVNQRGETTYTTHSSGDQYTIDRWLFGANNTITLQDGYISVGIPYSMVQYIEPDLWKSFAGRTLTFSLLYKDGTLLERAFKVNSDYTNVWIKEDFDNNRGALIFDWCNGRPRLVLYDSQYGDIVAVKLEFGDHQTLAHQENGNWVLNEIPNYGEQLARCQRYFQTFATESLRPTNALDFRPVMRTNPALSTITVGGKTLYTANADL